MLEIKGLEASRRLAFVEPAPPYASLNHIRRSHEEYCRIHRPCLLCLHRLLGLSQDYSDVQLVQAISSLIFSILLLDRDQY